MERRESAVVPLGRGRNYLITTGVSIIGIQGRFSARPGGAGGGQVPEPRQVYSPTRPSPHPLLLSPGQTPGNKDKRRIPASKAYSSSFN